MGRSLPGALFFFVTPADWAHSNPAPNVTDNRPCSACKPYGAGLANVIVFRIRK
ncbi:hypothetical protein C7S14_2365 [Burkholderia cepacia]|nr:hypothetical protein C7S14_2365 [Burkholderia cepacia]